jgi:purine nucleosidase
VTQPTARIPLILDVDTGVDDSLAILYACASPEVELVAVTCVAGNVPARQVAENTLAVLELAGRPDVPVILGAEQPLVRPLHTAEDTHGPLGLGHAVLPLATTRLAPGHAADRIVEAVRARPGEVLLVTLGPLTNLALALEREPALPRLLRGYALMGGAYRVPGNTTPTTEWNLHVDPDAAKAVFAAWAGATGLEPAPPRPLAMGLDVTELEPFLPAHLARLGLRAGCSHLEVAALAAPEPANEPARIENPMIRFVADALRFYFEFHAANDGFYGAYVHDPFAVAAALDRALVTTRPVFVDVEAGPGLANGMAIADWRGLTRRPPNLDVAVAADAPAFLDRLIDRVGGLAADLSGMSR